MQQVYSLSLDLYKSASNIVIISHKKLVSSMTWKVIKFLMNPYNG
nr:MAG TPA: hypothetical protein [Crassvirales sp.]